MGSNGVDTSQAFLLSFSGIRKQNLKRFELHQGNKQRSL